MIEQNHEAVSQLRILKDRRFDDAHRQLAGARSDLVVAETQLKSAREQLQAYQQYRAQEKDRLYAEFESQTDALYLKDIYQLNKALVMLKSKEMRYEQTVTQQVEAKQKADDAVSVALEQFTHSQKEVEKIAFVENHVQQKVNHISQQRSEEESDEIVQINHSTQLAAQIG